MRWGNIHDEKRPKDERKTQHLEGRAYAVKFRDDEASVLNPAAPPFEFES